MNSPCEIERDAYYTPQEIANIAKVTPETVYQWIQRKELHATNVGRAPGKGKPRWRILGEQWHQFISGRSTVQPQATRKARRHRKAEAPPEYVK